MPNGSRIILFPESIDVDPQLERWRGLEVNGFALEEGTELKERSYWKSVERAGSWILPSKQPVPPLVLITCNPAPGWVKRIFADPHRAGTLEAPLYFLQARGEDNPYNPPALIESWKQLPERDYNRFVLGSWDDMTGAALTLSEQHHLVAPFRVPARWRVFASFDWGYSHPWIFALFCANEDGDCFLVETIRGRRMRDPEILARIDSVMERLGVQRERLEYIAAGHDCWSDYQAHRSDGTPSTAERFTEAGYPLSKANVARKAGLKNLREYLAYLDAEGQVRQPGLRMMRTPNNLRRSTGCVRCWWIPTTWRTR